MGLNFKLDHTIGMCRSVGDWPNGVVIMDISNPCEPSWAVDWCYPAKPIDEVEKEAQENGGWIEMAAIGEASDHLERVSNEDAVAACDSIEEAMALWTMTCSIASDTALKSATDPTIAHEFFHMSQFALELFNYMSDEAEHRDSQGRRIDE
jgi:hypothetical protein